MVFSSLVFLWIFLPIVLVLYYICPERLKNVLLLIASLFFYAWGEPVYVLLMLFSIVCNFFIGIMLDRSVQHKKAWLVLAVILNLGMLGFFKYADFFLEILSGITGTAIPAAGIALPIGISFFTFQVLSYIIDLYRGQYPAQKNFINLAVYISFFPQLIAGPIVRYRDISAQLDHRSIDITGIAEGIRRFAYGLGKKVIIANTLAECVDAIYSFQPPDITGAFAWTAALFYTLQIYYDFSGYSDMAIGLGRMFGFGFPENFNYPYLSRSIHEYWQRWHISLGTWFREYVYIPLGGNRLGTRITYENLIIVFLLTGLWHGASAVFVIWGLYHGFFQIMERLGFGRFLKKHNVFSHIYTMAVLVFGFVIFRSETIHDAGIMAKRMLLFWHYTDTTQIFQIVVGSRQIFTALIGILGCGIIQSLSPRLTVLVRYKYSYAEIVICMLIIVLSISMLAGDTYNPFIYFRF